MSRDVAPFILLIEGSVSCKHPHQHNAAGVDRASAIRAGDTILADGGAKLSAALLPNLLVEVRGAAELQIGKLALTKDGDETGEQSMRERVAHLKLQHGLLVVSHERLDVAAEPDLLIETPFGTVTTTYDSLFMLDVNGERTRLTSVTGYVSFARQNHPPTPVVASSVGEWSADSAVIAAAAADARAQQEISDTLETEQKLRQLRSQLRDVLPHAKR